MRILIVSYYAEAHLPTSAAQNTRFLARGLREQGHEVQVVCAATREAGTIVQDGYKLARIKINKPEQRTARRFFGWMPNAEMRQEAEDYLSEWNPDVLVVGAWKPFAEFAFVANEQQIPVVQIVHDYSILCVRQWLLDSWGEVCSGPTSVEKCVACVRRSLGKKGRVKDNLARLTFIRAIGALWSKERSDIPFNVESAVEIALSYMQKYRDLVSLFVAQAPSVMIVLESVKVDSKRCRLVPQYVGEEKLNRYPRAGGLPGVDRAVRFVFVGRWTVEKGSKFLMDTFLATNNQKPIELWIIAANLDKGKIDAITAKSIAAKKSIKVFNNLVGADVARKLALADVCVVPSTCQELASRVVVEANAQGVPVVASSTVGNNYVIDDNQNGKIFSVGNVEELRHCIEMIAADPSILRRWSKRIDQPIDKESWLSLWQKVINEADNYSQAGP